MIPRITITVVASLPIFNSFFSDSLGFNFLYISIVNIVEHELNTDASEPEYSKIVGLSFGTLTKEQRLENKNSYETIDVILSISLVIIVVAILSYFTG